MEVAILGLVRVLVVTMLYLAHRIGKLEGCVKSIEKRLNEIQHQLKQLIKG